VVSTTSNRLSVACRSCQTRTAPASAGSALPAPSCEAHKSGQTGSPSSPTPQACLLLSCAFTRHQPSSSVPSSRCHLIHLRNQVKAQNSSNTELLYTEPRKAIIVQITADTRNALVKPLTGTPLCE
jgi:hypothetical protein